MDMSKIPPSSASLMGIGRALGFRFSFSLPVVGLFFEKNLLERVSNASYFGGLVSPDLSMCMQFLIHKGISDAGAPFPRPPIISL